MKLTMGFRLAYLNLTLAKGQLGNWNGVSPNILAFCIHMHSSDGQLFIKLYVIVKCYNVVLYANFWSCS